MFDRSVWYPKYSKNFDIANIYFIIALISVDHASVLWVLFYKILKVLSVPLEFSYLPIVPSLYILPFVKGMERTFRKWDIRGGIQNSQ